MIFDINEENVDLLAITGCPVDLRVDGACMLRDEGVYGDSCIDTCRACWLKYLSKESEQIMNNNSYVYILTDKLVEIIKHCCPPIGTTRYNGCSGAAGDCLKCWKDWLKDGE